MAFKTKIAKIHSRIRRFNKHSQSVWFWFRDGNEEPMVVPIERLREGDCLTGACIAGHVALMYAPDGTRFDRSDDQLLFPDGTSEDIGNWAAGQLGLDDLQQDSIFMCFNDEAALARLAHLTKHPDATAAELNRIYE